MKGHGVFIRELIGNLVVVLRVDVCDCLLGEEVGVNGYQFALGSNKEEQCVVSDPVRGLDSRWDQSFAALHSLWGQVERLAYTLQLRRCRGSELRLLALFGRVTAVPLAPLPHC